MRKRREKESAIEDRVVRWAVANGIMHRKMDGLGHKGWPDQLFLLPNGIAAFVEFKKPKEELTPLQNKFLRELVDRKQYATWTDDSDAAIAWLGELLKLQRVFGKAKAKL